MRTYRVKVIPGDGIGPEVVAEGMRVLRSAAEIHGGIAFSFEEYDWSCAYYLRHGRMMPADALQILADCDCILLGAVGYPGVPDHVSLRGLLIPIRQGFDQYINLRPMRLLPGIRSPLRDVQPGDIDFVVIRENSEGEYCGKGRFENRGTADEVAIQEAWFTRKGTERVIRYAFEYALKTGRGSVVSATKSNALNYSMVLWDEVFDALRPEYEGKGIRTRSILVDALAGLLILKPASFEVIVASNLFGDILTDLGAAMCGSIGIAPSANINPEGEYPSMFEPIHGSAPDIAGKGIANPIGTIWAVSLMLEHLGRSELAALVMRAVEDATGRGAVTPDLGGTLSTREVGDEICRRMRELAGH